ncbi:DDE-type integrase/transposase/recombinase [Nocardia sp. NPDC058519]|uniref:DDE-type integrase/transposase/recombinase n=1 Tax=Nocardia sp. NPDC058519 TaxID=3346535 RepID=UPI00364B9D0D
MADLLDQQWWSSFGKKCATKNSRSGPPFITTSSGESSPPEAPNALWLTDITEHHTGEGKLYLCAIKDVLSNRIVGYSIDSRMKTRLAVHALSCMKCSG